MNRGAELAARKAALRVAVLSRRDGLDGRAPEREGAPEVLDEDADEPFQRAVDGAVDGDGALLAMDGAVIAQPSPRVDVVDTTGAGDAFNAGFLDAWLNRASPTACLAAAIDAGSRSVQAAGGTGSLAASA